MNWAGLVVALGLIALGVMSLPWGAVLLVGLWWLWKRC